MKLNIKRTILVGFAFFLISLFWQAYDATIALTLTNKAVVEALDGLPGHKIHCSVLAEEAIKAALKDYYDRNGIAYDHKIFPDCASCGHCICTLGIFIPGRHYKGVVLPCACVHAGENILYIPADRQMVFNSYNRKTCFVTSNAVKSDGNCGNMV